MGEEVSFRELFWKLRRSFLPGWKSLRTTQKEGSLELFAPKRWSGTSHAKRYLIPKNFCSPQGTHFGAQLRNHVNDRSFRPREKKRIRFFVA